MASQTDKLKKEFDKLRKEVDKLRKELTSAVSTTVKQRKLAENAFKKAMTNAQSTMKQLTKTGDKLSKLVVETATAARKAATAKACLLYTSPSPRDGLLSRMPSSA